MFFGFRPCKELHYLQCPPLPNIDMCILTQFICTNILSTGFQNIKSKNVFKNKHYTYQKSASYGYVGYQIMLSSIVLTFLFSIFKVFFKATVDQNENAIAIFPLKIFNCGVLNDEIMNVSRCRTNFIIFITLYS